MADPYDKIQKKVADLEDKIAEPKAQMIGATGSVQHSLAGPLNLALAADASLTPASCIILATLEFGRLAGIGRNGAIRKNSAVEDAAKNVAIPGELGGFLALGKPV